MKALRWMICATLTTVTLAFAAPKQPNVILIMTDDQGYGDLGCNGNPWLKTPNIDKLASQSVRLDDYHTSPYCVPSRAALLTGRYADRTGVHNVVVADWIARGDEFMMSTSFKNAGYATGMFGKWHLGDNYPFGPEYHDFDEVLRHYGGAVGVLADHWDNSYLDDTYYRNGEPTKLSGYCTDVFFSAARQFVERTKKQEKPFFIYLATNAPHGPLICPPAYSKPYATGKAKRAAKFYGMIANIDENVGKLRAYLQEQGLAENTIFIYTTDNGSSRGNALFNAGMKGGKGSNYDGGHRVPLFLHWPAGGFKEERRIKTLTGHIDIFPTLLDLCGMEKPEGVKMDGISIRPLLEKGDHKDWPARMMMTDNQKKHLPSKWATTTVMSERWRLIDNKELYDIDADPGQRSNVIDKHPEVVQQLRKYYDELWADLQPGLNNVPMIPLAAPDQKTVALNYHDCVNRHPFWFQNDIRRIAKHIDPPKNKRAAFWPVEVVAEGEYSIELRRWPVEIDHPIHADLPPGAPVYGGKAHRSTPGAGFPAIKATLSVGDQQLTAPVDRDAKAVVFKTRLPAGAHRISAKFYDAEDRSLDAFYLYVTKAATPQ